MNALVSAKLWWGWFVLMTEKRVLVRWHLSWIRVRVAVLIARCCFCLETAEGKSAEEYSKMLQLTLSMHIYGWFNETVCQILWSLHCWLSVQSVPQTDSCDFAVIPFNRKSQLIALLWFENKIPNRCEVVADTQVQFDVLCYHLHFYKRIL